VTAAEVIAGSLDRLPLPDGRVVTIPGLSSGTFPEPMREQIQGAAHDVANGILYLLETQGYRVVAPGESTPVEAPPATIGKVVCGTCEQQLLALNLTDPERIVCDGKALIAGLSARPCSGRPGCPN